MDRLNTASVALEWAARLTGPVILWGFGLAGIATAVGLWDDDVALAVAVGAAGLVTTATGLHLIVRAVRRLRTGPKAPPGQGL
ncbi:hypothetical protein [Glycomyces salinus]|uniref:hypothetical protein n=1 Tax=Glycomyces salinus TaxID=980294 RepID=UPI0018EB9CF0|nr:hypothetical protein [Glycomyces salinus]